MPLNTNIAVRLGGDFTNALDLSATADAMGIVYSLVMADGTGTGQATQRWSDTRTLTTAASDSLDLNGVLANAFGAVTAFTAIKAIYIRSADANTTVLTIGNGATPFFSFLGAATHTVTLNPGGVFLITSPQTGFSATAATADILKITNAAGASATYDICVIGIG